MLPPTPRAAASLILLRDRPEGVEVLLGRRRVAARAFPDALVFPGGKVEPGDAEAEARAGLRPGAFPAPPGAAYAALRETFEEAGVWVAQDGAVARFPDRPGLDRMVAFAHWITPERYAYRFDTWFFLALANAAEADAPLFGDEFEALSWRRPAHALQQDRDALLPPTRHSLARLAELDSAAAIFEAARASAPFEAREPDTAWVSGTD